VRAAIAVSMVVLVTVSCNSRNAPEAGDRRAMPAVALPDLSRLEESVQVQLRERYGVLATKQNDAGTPVADLGTAYGEMGTLLLAAGFQEPAAAALLDAQSLAPGDMRWPYYLGDLYRTRGDVPNAIAAFERTVVSTDSRFDRWVEGDRHAITKQEWRGYQVFKDPAKGNCSICHSGPNFTDNGYHNIGIAHAPGAEDAGRYKIRPVAVLKGAFKTPTLRDVELTAPYFHNGTATTLAEVVEHYARGGDDRSNVSKDVRTLDLTAQDKADLVAFMKTLTGPTRSASIPALPQ